MFLTAIFALAVTQSLPQATSPEDVAITIAAAYDANVAKLSRSVSIRFRVSIGRAADLDAAIAGRWTKRSEGRGIYLSDGKAGRFEQIFDPALLKKQMKITGANSFTSTIQSIRRVTDGEVSLWDDIRPTMPGEPGEIEHDAEIVPGTTNFTSSISLPLNLGNPAVNSISKQVGYVVRKEHEARIVKAEIGSATGKGGRAVVITENVGGENEFVIDLEHGAIPTRTETRQGPKRLDKIWCIQEDIRRVKNDAWYPHRLLWYYPDTRAIEYVIESADFEAHPTRDDFTLEFEEPIQIRNTAANMGYPPMKVWNLQTLPRKGEKGVYPSIPLGKDSVPPVMPGEIPPSRVGNTTWAAIAAAVVAVIAGVYRR